MHPEWEFGAYVWKLKKALYGMRSAPRAWQEHLSQLLEDAGFQRGVAAPTLFYSAKYDTLVDVHVDDIHATGSETGLTYLFAYLKEHLCIKVSPIHGQDSEYTFLRAKRIRKDGRLTVTPCEDYARGAAKLLDLTHCRPATTPGFMGKFEDIDDELLEDPAEITKYRSVVGKLLYLSHYRYDMQFHVGMLCQEMQKPTGGGMKRAKHLVRYYMGTHHYGLVFGEHSSPTEITVFTDSDWAGSKDRRSVSSGVTLLAGCPMASWSRTQLKSSVALSSGEAEFLAAVTAVIEGLGIAAVLEEINIVLPVRIHVDSTVCLAVLHRLGAGSRFKHVGEILFCAGPCALGPNSHGQGSHRGEPCRHWHQVAFSG